MSNFFKKYLKYKIKYNTLKNGGNPFSSSKINEIPHINKSDFYYKKTIESSLIIEELYIEDFSNFYSELL